MPGLSDLASGGGGLSKVATISGGINFAAGFVAGAGPANGVATVLSGAQTAGVLKTLLTISGKGAISALGVRSQDVTSRTIRLKITIDGVVVFDQTSAAVASASAICSVIGASNITQAGSAWLLLEGTPILFNSSLLVECASSLTETDKILLAHKTYTRS